MNDRTAGRLAVAAAAAIGVVTVAGAVLAFGLNRSVIYGNDVVLWVLFTATTAAYVVAGVAIVRRTSSHLIGWLCLLTAAALELSLTLTHYAIYAIGVAPGGLPGGPLAVILASPLPGVVLTGIVLILHLFPTGHPVGPRWRWLVGATVAGIVLDVARNTAYARVITDVWSDELSHAGASARNPLGFLGAGTTLSVVGSIAAALTFVGAIGAVVSLFVRRRRASADERLQLRWLAVVAGAAAAWILVMGPVMVLTGPDGPAGAVFWSVITPLVALGPPAAIGIGIVKYRLFDIDVVIRKTVVVGVVAFTLTALYLGVLALATLAPVSRALVGLILLALTFNPIRRAARAIADRAAYGRRASSYEVLSDFSAHLSPTYSADDVLPRMAEMLATGTGARTATVWLRVGPELRPAATAGAGNPSLAPATVVDEQLPPIPQEATEVRDHDELLGALGVEMPTNDPLDLSRERLIRDLAGQAGLVLRNVRLIEELRASRQRLVAAQDQERRRIERNIHDGAQQQLVALQVKLGLVRRMTDGVPGPANAAIDQLQQDAQQALDDLRDLARGIYPPLLADQGLRAAVESQVRRSPVPVRVEAAGVNRYPPEVEAAVYFSVLEALQNVAKYAQATAAIVTLSNGTGSVQFTISDDGVGFDAAATNYGTGLQGMADRLAALGGTLDVRAAPGQGTQVVGRVPVLPGDAP